MEVVCVNCKIIKDVFSISESVCTGCGNILSPFLRDILKVKNIRKENEGKDEGGLGL